MTMAMLRLFLQDELTKGSSVAEEEARKRSEYMKAQRDKLVAAKKREREEKVQAEDSRLGRKQQPPVSAVRPSHSSAPPCGLLLLVDRKAVL